jgi:Rrf2 family protein
MLAMTKKTGYGLVAMTHLARLPAGQVASAREIAELFGVPGPLLMNVLKELSAAGYVESVRGARGGYRLARRPEDITLAGLVEALEGPVRLAECMTEAAGEGRECTFKLMSQCPVADPVHRVQRRLSEFLKKVTLAEFVEPAGELVEK